MSFDLSTLTTIALAFSSGLVCRKTLGEYFANKIIQLLNYLGVQLKTLWLKMRSELTTTMEHLPRSELLSTNTSTWFLIMCCCLFSGYLWVYAVLILSAVSILFLFYELPLLNLLAGLIFSVALFLMYRYYRASARELAAKKGFIRF